MARAGMPRARAMRASVMAPELLQFVADHGTGGVALYFLWRLTEKIGAMAEGFSACSAKMDSLILLLGKDNNA